MKMMEKRRMPIHKLTGKRITRRDLHPFKLFRTGKKKVVIRNNNFNK